MSENTPEQVAFHEANEGVATEESSWPVYEVSMSGDPVEWEARPNPEYWQEDDDGNWVPKEGQNVSADGKVIMPATCTVITHAKNEDHAKFLAMKAEEDAGYHTITGVREITQ
jgi:hypothetical protein